MPNERLIRLRNASRSVLGSSAVGVSMVGVMLLAGGCGERWIRRADPIKTNEPVNSTLSNLAKESGPALPVDETLMDDQGFGTVHDQIEESARQLNVYFANLEMDGVSTADSADAETDAVAVAGEDAAAETTPPSVAQPSDEQGADAQEPDDGVRVTLLGASGSENQSKEEVSTQEPGSAKSAEGAPEGSSANAADAVGVDETDKTGEPEAVVEPVVEQSPQERKAELAHELATILAEMASTSDDPGSAALALASIETLLPDDTDALLDEGVLSDAEKESIEATRSFLRSMSSEGTIASPAQVSAKLDEIRAQLDQWAGLSITRALLCTKVEGYGRYETFPSYRFVAGRAQPVVVYVELERFAQREFTGPDGQARYETKVSQRLELYHASDDLNTWNRAAETVSDETRNRLRDYYLTNTVTLPANLGVGRYHLKVVMRDLIGARVAETIIPIEIVSR